MDILPSSKCNVKRGIVRLVHLGVAVNMLPIYCASCGKSQGLVQEDFCTFAYMTCDECDAKYGVIAGVMCEPNAVLWERVREAQKKHPVSSFEDWCKKLDDPTSIYSKIFKEAV